MAKLGAQFGTFKSVTNKQTGRQTDTQKTERFWLPQRRVKSQPHHGMLIEDFKHVAAPLKLLGSDTVSPVWGAENVVETRPPQLKTHITP